MTIALLALSVAIAAGAVGIALHDSRDGGSRRAPAVSLVAVLLSLLSTVALTAAFAPGQFVFISFAANTVTLLAWLVVVGRRRFDDRGDDDDGGGGHGGDDPRTPRGGEGDPVWWPQFERDFRAYARRRALRTPAVPSR